MTTVGEPAPAQPGTTSPTERLVGFLLIIPALILWVVQLVVPTVRTMIMSLQDSSPIARGPAMFVGLDNYLQAVRDDAAPTFLNVALFTVPTMLIMIVVGLLIGAFAARGTRLVRRVTRGILGLGLVLYAPIGIVLARELPRGGSPAQATLLVATAILIALAASAGSAVGLVSMAAWRSGAKAGFTVAGLIVAVGLGLGVQLLALPLVLTGGGPGRSTETPMLLATTLGFQHFKFGPAAALSFLVWLIVAFWGIVATAIIVLGRLRMELDPPRAPERGSGIGWLGPAVAGLSLLIMIILLAPWLAGTAQPWPPSFPAIILVNTWLPSLVGAVVQLIIAVVAGFGIGWLRPLGRFSEAALLIFSPWLLTGEAILVLQHYGFLSDLGLLGTLPGLLPASMINVPAVVAITLLFAAVRRLRDRGAPVGELVAPLIGVGLTTFLLLWLIQAQGLISGYVNGTSAESMTGPMALLMAAGRAWEGGQPQSLSMPLPWLILLAAGSITIQVLLLDRLRLAAGR